MRRLMAITVALFLLLTISPSWPTGSSNVNFNAGPHTLNLHFDELPRPWWDSNYMYRSQITINAGSSAVPADYSISMDIDHASLVSAGKSRIDGEDVRLVHWNGTAWLEIDRALDTDSAWNSTSTKIWFKTQREITISDDAYYLHYGNPVASSPPTNKSRIFTFFDDFENGNLAKWTIQIDGIWSAGMDQAHSGTYSLKADPTTPINKTQKWMTAKGINETDMVMEAYWRMSSVSSVDFAQGHRTSATTPINQYETLMEGSDGWDIAKLVNGSWTEIVDQPAGQNPQKDVWTRITTINIGSSMKMMKDGVQIVPASGWTDVGNELSSGSVGLRIWNMPIGQAWWIDDVIVRRYVDPEPTASLGPEDSDANVQIIAGVYHVMPDGSDPQEIVTSPTITIDSTTPNPLTLNIGNGAQYNFTDAVPRLLRLEINVTAVNGGERFALAYDSTIQPTNLVTPSSPTNTYYLYDMDTTGVTPSGKVMNTTIGTGGANNDFDTPGQGMYWYTAMWSPLSVSILSPVQDEHITGTYDITYSASVPISNISFDYSEGAFWRSIGFDSSFDGTFTFDSCEVGDRITDVRATARTAWNAIAVDTVTDIEIDCTPPSIQILQPLDFSEINGTVPIVYIVDPDAVLVELRYDDGRLHTIATEAPPDGSALWTIGNQSLKGVVLRGIAWDEVGLSSEDQVSGLSTPEPIIPISKPPTISGVPDIIVHYDYSYNFDLSPYINDEDTPLDQLTILTSDSSHIWTNPLNNLGLVMNYPQSMHGQTVQVTIWVSDGNASDFQVINITILDDYPPEKLHLLPDVSFDEDETVLNVFFTNMDYYFLDIDGDNLYYTSGNESVKIRINANKTVDMWAEPDWFGFEIITIRATDPTGALVEDVVIVQVNPVNDAPVIDDIPDIHTTADSDEVLDIMEYVHDIDTPMDSLVISVESGHVTTDGFNLTLRYPSSMSEDLIRITVSDGVNSSYVDVRVIIETDEDFWLWFILVAVVILLMCLYYMANKPEIYVGYLIREDGALIKEVNMTDKRTVPYGLIREKTRAPGMGMIKNMDFGTYKVAILHGKRLHLAVVSSSKLEVPTRAELQEVVKSLDHDVGEEKFLGDNSEETASILDGFEGHLREIGGKNWPFGR